MEEGPVKLRRGAHQVQTEEQELEPGYSGPEGSLRRERASEVVIWLIWGIKVVFSTNFFVFLYFPVEQIVFYFGLST